MMRMPASTPALVDQEGAVDPGGAADLDDRERRRAPDFERAEPRQRAMASLRGLLRPAERKPSWPWADLSGDAAPEAFQHLLRRALWDPEAVRDALRRSSVQPLGDPAAGAVLDDTGFLNKGQHSAGVARPSRGTAGTVEHGQLGVWLGSASPRGHALLERERSLPQAWSTDRARGQQAGTPTARRLATQPQLAQQRLARAFAAGVPAPWITGDRVDGHDRRRRWWWEAQPRASVLAVSGQAYVWLGGRPRQVNTLLAARPDASWTRLRAGDGTKGPRWYAWQWWPLAEPLAPDWRRGWRVRRRGSAPTERQAYVVFAPRTPRWPRGSGSQGPAGPARAVLPPLKVKWGGPILPSGVGPAGIGLARWPWGRWP